MDAKELPPEVAKLYKRNGEWSKVHTEDTFFFDCFCKSSAVCRLVRNVEDDTWLAICPNKTCKHHGERTVETIELGNAARKSRKKFAKELATKIDHLNEEVEHITALAVARKAKPTPYVALFNDIVDIVRKYVYLPRDQALILALWVGHTYCISAFEYTPYIHLRSALPQEGKSRVLDVMEFLVARPMRIYDPTAASIFTWIDVCQFMYGMPPTLLWDEIDDAYHKHSDLRGIVNAGFQRGTMVLRAAGSRGTFAPKMMAGLGVLPDTVTDRSMRFDMVRAGKQEKPARLTPSEKRRLKTQTETIRVRLELFAEFSLEDLSSLEPKLPAALDDRAQDISEPLLAIADLIGGTWPKQARSALVSTRTHMKKTAEPSERLLLLKDLKEVFGRRTQMSSEELVEGLRALSESPWQSISLTQNKLARLLSNFSVEPGGARIKSRKMRIGGRSSGNRLVYGYDKKMFADAWGRYL